MFKYRTKPTNSLLAGLLPALLMLLPLAVAAQAEQQEREEIDRIVALVEDDVILKSELDQAVMQIRAQLERRGERLPPRGAVEEQVLERLILTRLQVLRARDTGIRVSDADVDNALERVAAQNNLSVAGMREALAADGIDMESFRDDMREQIMTSRLRQRVASSMDEITESEVDILLASEQFAGGEYLLSQIVIGVPESASPAEAREAEARAGEVYAELQDGLEFASAAISYSQGPDALEGGDLGWRSLNAMPRMFADAVADAEPGDVLEPIRTPSGYVLLKVRDVRESGAVIVEEYRARHMMVRPSELVTPEQARERIQSLHRRIAEGEDFAELAREYSDDESTANLGGLMDWFPADAYGSAVENALEGLEPGELSQPFQSGAGWHFLRLEDVREADRTEEATRAQAREMLFEQKAEEEVDRFLRQLRHESFVEVRL